MEGSIYDSKSSVNFEVTDAQSQMLLHDFAHLLSSANKTKVEWSTWDDKSLTNMLKSSEPKVLPWGDLVFALATVALALY